MVLLGFVFGVTLFSAVWVIAGIWVGDCDVLVKCVIVWVGRFGGVWLIVLLVLLYVMLGWF